MWLIGRSMAQCGYFKMHRKLWTIISNECTQNFENKNAKIKWTKLSKAEWIRLLILWYDTLVIRFFVNKLKEITFNNSTTCLLFTISFMWAHHLPIKSFNSSLPFVIIVHAWNTTIYKKHNIVKQLFENARFYQIEITFFILIWQRTNVLFFVKEQKHVRLKMSTNIRNTRTKWWLCCGIWHLFEEGVRSW